MAEDINWLISNYGDFLKRFGLDQAKILKEFESWKIKFPDYSTAGYFFHELLRQASLFNIKNANTEEEFANVNIEIISKQLEVQAGFSSENRNYLIQQLHFNKLMLSRLTLPFKFEVQIKADNCCSYCARNNNKIYSLEKILKKKYLPYSKCENEKGCECSYLIIPLIDENGSLLQKDA